MLISTTEQAIKSHEAMCQRGKENFLIPDGPWDEETHRIEFEAYGMRCLVLRNPYTWFLCGYVAIRPDHPLYGKHVLDYALDHLDVHGAITYSDRSRGAISYHLPEYLWWLGFECSHAGDLIPSLEGFKKHFPSVFVTTEINKVRNQFPQFKETYKGVNWVKRKTTELAKQLSSFYSG